MKRGETETQHNAAPPCKSTSGHEASVDLTCAGPTPLHTWPVLHPDYVSENVTGTAETLMRHDRGGTRPCRTHSSPAGGPAATTAATHLGPRHPQRAGPAEPFSYLVGVGGFTQVDAVADELVPDHDLQLQPGVDDEPTAARRPPPPAGALPRTRPPPGLLLPRYPAGAAPSGGGRRPRGRRRRLRLQGEVEPRRRLVRLLQPPHGFVNPAPVVGHGNADGIQVRVPDLLADLQVVVAIIDEGLRVLEELQGLQPLVHYVGAHAGSKIIMIATFSTEASLPLSTPRQRKWKKHETKTAM